MLYWIYDVPPLLTVGLFAALFVGVCWIGVVLFRPFVRERLNPDARLNEILGDFLQYFGVMYGLLLGLLAVATYQNHTDVEKAVSSEASSLAALYRDVTAYPEPQRTNLKTLLREYTRYVVEEAWPLQRQGLVPPGGVKRIADFQGSLVSFEPQTKAHEALHDAAMRQFNSFFEYRRTRLYSVNSGIPPLLWYTVGVGALINMIFIWLFDLRLKVHLLLGGMISFFLATMISLIALMDHPFRGEVGVSSDAFQLVYDQLMKE
jgi:Protein of unknown function (DUF4239)